MIPIKTQEEIAALRRSAALLVKAFRTVEEAIVPDVTTETLDRITEEVIRSGGGTPAFKGYRGFPASVCASIDSEVVHGIPGERPVREGEIVSLDIGVVLDGFYTDAAKTYGVGNVSAEKKMLMETTLQSLHLGIEMAREGNRLTDISHAVQSCVEPKGLSVVRALVGHGIGRQLHEEPQIPNFGPPHRGPVLQAGMVLAIEPMINLGMSEVVFSDDGWTVTTADERPSAHFEHTVLVTNGTPEILTIGIEQDAFGREHGERTTHQG